MNDSWIKTDKEKSNCEVFVFEIEITFHNIFITRMSPDKIWAKTFALDDPYN